MLTSEAFKRAAMKKHSLKSLMKDHTSKSVKELMTQETMEKSIKESEFTEVLQEKRGYLLFRYGDKKVALMSDAIHDRMRLLISITRYSKLDAKVKDALMHSNFHLALDARYAVSDDIVYAAFIHPLSSLTADDFESALKQVYNLAKIFGTSYNSGKLEFKNSSK